MSSANSPAAAFTAQYNQLRDQYQASSFFTHHSPAVITNQYFTDSGTLITHVDFTEKHQSFDGRVHGGLLTAFTDSSMVECLLGHGILAYTAELTMHFKNPAQINLETIFTTNVIGSGRDKIYFLETQIMQGDRLIGEAKSKFFRFQK